MMRGYTPWADHAPFGSRDPSPTHDAPDYYGTRVGHTCDRDDCEGLLEADNGRVCCPACDWMGGKA